MENAYMEPELAGRNPKNVILGLVIGGLIGAAAMMLFAPQSGKQTRTQIQRKTVQLRGRTTDLGKKALTQIGSIPAKARQALDNLGS